jgi:murein DD-endopeptidase MepM/ murein hydrolase activator NlpD
VFFSVAGAVALTGCGIVGGSSATDTPTMTPTATRTHTPTRTPTPTPTDTPTPVPTDTPAPTSTPQPQAVVPSGDGLAQGRTLVISVPKDGAAGATAIYRGREHRMTDGGDVYWAVIGAGATQEIGAYTITVNMLDDRGALIREVPLSVTVSPTNWPVEYITLPPGQIEGIPAEDVQRELNIRAATFAQFTPQKLWNGPFILPQGGPLTANFGDARSYNGGPVGSHHSGTDFAADEGAPAMAAANGRVAFVGFLATRGNSVILDHGLGVFTAYHHLSRIDVAQGQEIAQGQVIGGVGATGLATGPHLHWELIVGGVNVDPVYWTYAGVAP